MYRILMVVLILAFGCEGTQESSFDPVPDRDATQRDAAHDEPDGGLSDDMSMNSEDAEHQNNLGEPDGWFPLVVNDVSGLDEPWPLMGGLPFPEGLVFDPKTIRIVSDEQEVPAQIDVTATWRDGSIRWALAGFMGSPQADYRVEFGAEVEASEHETALRVEETGEEGMAIDTGAARFEFASDALLPERMVLDERVVIDDGGAGAYLIDNQGREARVSGAAADIQSRFVKQGHGRVVLRREGWYVTDDGDGVARSRIWFYFTADSAAVRITHSLVFTEDTNDLWVRDYGLRFPTSQPPENAKFSYRDATDEELAPPGGSQLLRDLNVDELRAYSDLWTGPLTVDETRDVAIDDAEVYILQDLFPHFVDREVRAHIGRSEDESSEVIEELDVVGDWVDAAFPEGGLTVVVPWLAHQFPKDITVGPQGVSVALWSFRSGRELDFRAPTLVDQYYGTWAEYYEEGASSSPEAAQELAQQESNAQGASRTHDIWLLPRAQEVDPQVLATRAAAAARTPLVQADPAWLTDSGALGWLNHPVDTQQFGAEEAALDELWIRLMAHRYSSLRRTGLITWGGPPHIQGYNRFFRVSNLVDYGLRRHIWSLYTRSGDRRYLDYASRFNRFAGDLAMAHWDTDEKYRGGFINPNVGLPFHWHGETILNAPNGNTGHDIVQWILEHHLTGDEYAWELATMYGEAFKEHWPDASRRQHRYDGIHMVLRIVADLYAMDWDEEFGSFATEIFEYVLDEESPNGINDDIRFGALYKIDRNLISLYYYYRETGDERAREAFLKCIDFKVRFNFVSGPYAGQNYGLFLFSVAYEWTQEPVYLRVLSKLLRAHVDEVPTLPNVTTQINPTMGIGAALRIFSEVDMTDDPFPALEPEGDAFLVNKADEEVLLSVYIHMDDADGVPVPEGTSYPDEDVVSEITYVNEHEIQTAYDGRRNPERWHTFITIPASVAPGQYRIGIPDTTLVSVQDVTGGSVSELTQ